MVRGKNTGGKKVKKRGKNTYVLSQKEVKILRLLAFNLPIKNIAKQLKLSQKTIYKHFNRFCENKLITKFRELTIRGKKSCQHHSCNPIFSLHNVKIKVEIPSIYHDKYKKNRYRILKLKKISYEKKDSNIYDFPFFSVDRANVRANPNCFIIHLPEILEETPQKCTNIMMDLLFEYITKLEKIYRLSLIKDERLNISIISNDYAHIHNALAKKYRNDKNCFYLYGEDKKLRLIIDFSDGVDELEAVHPYYAEPDITHAHKQVNDWVKHNPPTNSQLSTHIMQNSNNINEISKFFDFYGKNLVSHVNVLKETVRTTKENELNIKKISESLDKFSLQMVNFNKIVKKLIGR